jgi:hypothetical protein
MCPGLAESGCCVHAVAVVWSFSYSMGVRIVNPALPPAVSGRYLSFAEREDIALLRAEH